MRNTLQPYTTNFSNNQQFLPHTPQKGDHEEMRLDFLPFLAQTVEQWQVHRCQVSEVLISQEQPMKLIYHYETLSDVVKLQHPLNGELLHSFDQLMNREQFAQLLGIKTAQVAKPWQLKFVGKIVIFHQHPDIALRLRWRNTMKVFEPIYTASGLAAAIDQAFSHWHIDEPLEIVHKNTTLQLCYPVGDTEPPQSLPHTAQFEALPPALSGWVADYLQKHPTLTKLWREMVIEAAKDYALTQVSTLN